MMAIRATGPLALMATRSLLMAASLTGCWGLHIVDLVVPEVIQNGSRSSVVLDCAYRYERYEQEGLVVKWFWDHGPEAVYQWIPGKKPEAMGVLKGRVNLDFSADRDKYTRHRALEILHPTTELTGVFTCRVSSFHDEEFASKKMIVYAPATNMNMSYHKPTPDTVNITCHAHGIFPKPRLRLFKGASRTTRSRVQEAEVEVVPEVEGFGIYLQSVLEDSSLRHETIFECVLSIPETEYQLQRKIIYLPGYNAFGGYGGATVVSGAPAYLLLFLLSLLLLLISPSVGQLTSLI